MIEADTSDFVWIADDSWLQVSYGGWLAGLVVVIFSLLMVSLRCLFGCLGRAGSLF